MAQTALHTTTQVQDIGRVGPKGDLKKRWSQDYGDAWVKNVLPRLDFTPALIEPELARLLGAIRGRRVLDAGCGEGRYSRYLKEHGARVVGIDGSEKLLTYARERDPDIDFQMADLLDRLDFANESMDAIVSLGVLMSLPQLDTFLSESCRILKKQGVLVISVHHPAFCNPTMRLDRPFWARWLRRPVVGRTFSYFAKGSGAESWPLYHRTIEEYVDAFRRHGFQIDRITEPHDLPEEILERDRNVEYATRLPRFIVFKLVSPASHSSMM